MQQVGTTDRYLPTMKFVDRLFKYLMQVARSRT